MSDPAQLQQVIQGLQSQINTLSSMVSNLNTVSVQPSFQQATPNVSEMVKAAVAAEMSKIKLEEVKTSIAQPQSLPVVANQQKQEESFGLPGGFMKGLLPILGAAFSEEQQQWLSKPQNLLGIPGFLMSKDGKDMLSMALDAYQSHVLK